MPVAPFIPPHTSHSAHRIRQGLVAASAGAALVVGAASALSAPASASTHVTVHRAPVLGKAAQGGAVIVWLKHQHAALNLRTQTAARRAADRADQRPIVAAIKAAGGTQILQMMSVNAVAAHVSAQAVQKLRSFAGVKQIIPDASFRVGDPERTGPKLSRTKIVPDRVAARHARSAPSVRPAANPFPIADCGTQADPLVEPEALTTIHAPAMTDAGLATEPGHGVIVANDGISSPPNFSLVGNPNFLRPAGDGGGSVVVDAQPGDTTDATDGEYYGDASSIAAQGTVEYQYSSELPYSGMPDTCYFKLVGDAPGASLIDTENINTPESRSTDTDPARMTESQVIIGIDAAVAKEHADVINESYGYSNTPGSYAIHYAANDAAVDAGVTVVASSGDSGVSGTVSSPASDPKIIAVGATNTLRLNAMAYGFAGWVNNDITPLSSGGTTPNNKLVDLVAPGYGGEAACNPNGSDCPTNTQTEAFGGTSESSPLVAGAAADVIQAYRDSHNGESPSPALVKQLLTGTATEIDAPADQQGAGLLNIGAAIAATKGTINSTVSASTTAASLIPSPGQLDLTGDPGSTSNQSVSLYNPNNASTTVTGTYRTLGPEQQLGDTVTENVSAPNPSDPVPADGAQAAPDVSFDVPAGLDRLAADMVWPDAKNNAILSFTLIDPSGRLRQISYDYGTASTTGGTGTVPDIQHVEVANPDAGTWTAEIKWANGRAHLQSEPNVPGTYTGTVSFKVSGQNWINTAASAPVTIAAHKSATIPLQVSMPNERGDHPQSVQFTADDGAAMSLPIARRTLVPSDGGAFDTPITSSVGRGLGQISTFDISVPSGRPDLGVTVTTPDINTDDPMTLYLVNPSGTSVATHVASGHTVNGVPLVVTDVGGTQMQAATFHVTDPMAGTWEIDVKLNLTTSGQEFRQTVVGDVLPQAPSITAPADGSTAETQTPQVSGTGAPGDTVTVVDGSAAAVCTATVTTHGTWSCTAAAQPAGAVTLTATQADETGDPSLASNSVTVDIPATIALKLSKSKVHYGHSVAGKVTVSGATGGTATVSHDSTVESVPINSSGVGKFTLPATLAVGKHTIKARYDGTGTAAPSDTVRSRLTVVKASSHTSLELAKTSAAHGSTDKASVTVGGHADGAYPTGTVRIVLSSHGSKHTTTAHLHAQDKGELTMQFAVPHRTGRVHVVAKYDGDSHYTASRSGRRTLHST